jgi:hypothetical protein
MTLRELHQLLETMIHLDPSSMQKEVRIGDQIESGPYLHASVGGVWRGRKGEVVIAANDDEVWKDESAGYHPDFELERIWP